MRVIKFRAYNKETGLWYSNDRIKALGNLQKLISLNHVHVMQFTGLKDNKGNEIYEGDIIISLVQSMRDDSITKVVGEVYFDEKLGGYMFGNKHSTDKEADTIEFGVCMALSDSVEIIGNVYDNSDLVLGVSKADA